MVAATENLLSELAGPSSRLTARVAKRVVADGRVHVTLEGGKKLPPLHRFALVGQKNEVVCKPGKQGTFAVVLPKGRGEVQVSPHWQWRPKRPVSILGKSIKVVVKEIETDEELREYELLTRHHYLTGSGATRRAPLIAKIDTPDMPKVVGFVELSSCFLVNVARKKVLDRPFRDRKRGVAWERWDLDTAKRCTNVIARISRCVVYPELRGVGVAGILAEAAKKFAEERWHIGGWRPSFLEITAEMLRYWPFVERAGFVKVGETEGNGARVEKSMTYLLGRKKKEGYPSGGGGILAMHKSHAETLSAVMEEQGSTVEQIVQRVKGAPEDLSPSDWVALHSLYRRPKPVYMFGVTKAAEKHLRRWSGKALDGQCARKPSASMRAGCLGVEGLDVRAVWEPEASRGARRVQEAFGIVAESLETQIVNDLSLRMEPGEIVLVGGASGSGKSLLLRALAWHSSKRKSVWKLPAEIQSEGTTVRRVKVAMLQRPTLRKSPIALLEEEGLDLEESMRLLASAGLGEAQLFVRPSSTLSSGQRYRLSLALALAQKPDLLLIDEFCEPLDDYSTAAVCSRLRKAVANGGLSAVVATANADRVVQVLRPDRMLRLLPNRQHSWERGS